MTNGNNELMPGDTDPAMSYRFASPDPAALASPAYSSGLTGAASGAYIDPQIAENNPSASDLFGGAYGFGPTSAQLAGNMLWGLGKKVAGGLWDFVSTPGQYATGERSIGEGVAPVTEFAGNLALNALGAKGLGFAAPPGSLGMIVGERAAAQMPGGLSKLQALEKAEELHGQGFDRDHIFDNTGWFLDEDNNWKFIMSDEGAKFSTDKLAQHYNTIDPATGKPTGMFNVPLTADPAQDLHLSDILQHGDLYTAYPWMRDINIKPMPPEMVAKANAGINNAANTIYISPLGKDQMFSSVAHEVQHIVQKAEGHARGGATKDFLPPDYNDNLSNANTERDDVEWNMRNAGYDPDIVARKLGLFPNRVSEPFLNADLSGLHPDLLSRYRSVTDNLRGLNSQYAEANRKYLNLVGEVGARSTQAMLHARVWDQAPWRVGTYSQKWGRNVPYPAPGTQIIKHQGKSWEATPMPEEFDPFDVTRSGGGQ